MKTIVIALVLCFVAATMGQGNGRPDCNTNFQLSRLWRNNFDPTAYWVCQQLGTPGVLVRCPQAFLEPEQRCGEWTEWNWVPPVVPPNHN